MAWGPMVALAIYSGAYLTEIFSAGIISVGKRYLDAGRSLGLTRFELARHITGPIMFRTVLPSLSNTFIGLFKDTSIATVIAVPEALDVREVAIARHVLPRLVARIRAAVAPSHPRSNQGTCLSLPP